MSGWTTPLPGDIAERFAGAMEAIAGLTDADGNPVTLDARSPNRVLTAQARVTDLSLQDLYLYVAYLARELMPDTAIDWLSRHGDIWGVPQLPASAAVGSVLLTDNPGAPVPSGIALTDGAGTTWRTTGFGVIGPGGTASVPVRCDQTGPAGNRPANTLLPFVSPVAGLTATSATVDANGLAGGAAVEDIEAWRARILARIRTPGAAGDIADYVGWARAAGAAFVNVVGDWQGAGTVGVLVAMPGPTVATPAQVAAIQAAIDAVRPVTAQAIVVAAGLLAVPVTLHLNPDTAAIRAAAGTALAAQFALDQQVGGTIYRSRLEVAVAVTDGETSDVMLAPAADVAAAPNQLPVLGPVNFV